jgi:putative membrane protein
MLLDKKVPLLYILNKIKWELVYVLLIALAVYYLTLKYHAWFPPMPLTIPTFIGTAISILLSFKINQSYDR